MLSWSVTFLIIAIIAAALGFTGIAAGAAGLAKILFGVFLVLFIVTFFDAAVHQCYFFWTGRYLEQGVGIAGNWVMPVMSLGQIAEIGTMAFLGYFLKRLGWRYTMVIGILGHAVRFTVFAFAPQVVPAILVILLHGICYAFFFATVYIFVDEFFPKDARIVSAAVPGKRMMRRSGGTSGTALRGCRITL